MNPLRAVHSIPGQLRLRLMGLQATEPFTSDDLSSAPGEVRSHIQARTNAFRDAFNVALSTPTTAQLVDELSRQDAAVMPFAVEGASMASALLDHLPIPGRHRWARLYCALGPARSRLVTIGEGWACAALNRSPEDRPRWRDPSQLDLVREGAGFHDGLFATKATLGGPLRPSGYYRGVGRSLWFIHAARPERAELSIQGVDNTRARAALWWGFGYAARYAGPCTENAWAELLARAGQHAPAAIEGGRAALSDLAAEEHPPLFHPVGRPAPGDLTTCTAPRRQAGLQPRTDTQ
ncbi:DUF1702 family protein [Actinomycetota bacterium]